MGNFLVIGGSGVMGTAAINAVRKTFGSDAKIIANWYAKEDTGLKIENADHTVFGDITNPKVIEKLKALGNGKFEYLFYATALGDVGFAINESTPDQIMKSKDERGGIN